MKRLSGMTRHWGPAATVLATGLGAAVLTGCGGSGDGSTEDFCASYESLEARSDRLTSAESLAEVESLAENAPSEIEDDVAVVKGASDQLREALEGTGVDLDVPNSDLSQEERTKLGEAATTIDVDQEQLAEAGSNITKWAEDNCAS
jgi:hypothetical protein